MNILNWDSPIFIFEIQVSQPNKLYNLRTFNFDFLHFVWYIIQYHVLWYALYMHMYTCMYDIITITGDGIQ